MEFAGVRLLGDSLVGPDGPAPLLGASAELVLEGGKRKFSGRRAVLLGPVGALATAKKEGGELVLRIRASGLSVDLPVPVESESAAKQFAEALNGAAEQARSVAEAGERGQKQKATEEQKLAKQAQKEQKARVRAAAHEARIEERAAQTEQAGAMVESATFAAKTVKIYANGFIRVEGLFRGATASYERLLSIEASADVGKKSAAGRGAAALMTGGLNLLGSKQRGDVYLTLVTDKQTHVLHEDPPTVRGMKASKALEAAGKAVLDRVGAASAPSVPSVVNASDTDSVAARLRQLTNMREEGLVSEDEFERLRARLLDSL